MNEKSDLIVLLICALVVRLLCLAATEVNACFIFSPLT